MRSNLEAVNCYRTINSYSINVVPHFSGGKNFLEQLPGFPSLWRCNHGWPWCFSSCFFYLWHL